MLRQLITNRRTVYNCPDLTGSVKDLTLVLFVDADAGFLLLLSELCSFLFCTLITCATHIWKLFLDAFHPYNSCNVAQFVHTFVVEHVYLLSVCVKN